MRLFRHYDDNESDEYIYDGTDDEVVMIDARANNGTATSMPPLQMLISRYSNISSADNILADQSPPSATSPMDAIVMSNCTYRHDISNDLIRTLSLWLDGPITIIAAILAFVGCHFAVRFLARAGLNRELTAALYTLCVCDAFLISMVVLYQSIEATSILLFVDCNVMWDKQSSVLITHGIVSCATTASTLLVVFITFQRFLVVRWPLRYARMRVAKRPTVSLHDAFLRKSSSSGCVEDTEMSAGGGQMFRSGGGLARTLSKRLLRGSSNNSSRKSPALRKLLRPFIFPVCVVVFAFLLNFSVFFEFELVPCFAFAHNAFSLQLFPTPLRRSQTYYMIRTIIAMGSQTIGPILTITLLTIVTEYKVHRSLKARRMLFESQGRRRSVVALEELREKVSRTVAIFIAIKFLIFRSLPIFFDIYESCYGIESFGIILSILVRLSDFGVVLNSATNSLAYFGKTEFFANRLRGKLLREKQHIMVAKVAASACLVSPSPAIERSSSKSSVGTAFGDISRLRALFKVNGTAQSQPRRRQRNTVMCGKTSVSFNESASSRRESPLLRISFLSLRHGAAKASGTKRRRPTNNDNSRWPNNDNSRWPNNDNSRWPNNDNSRWPKTATAVVEDGGMSIRHNGYMDGGTTQQHQHSDNNNDSNEEGEEEDQQRSNAANENEKGTKPEAMEQAQRQQRGMKRISVGNSEKHNNKKHNARGHGENGGTADNRNMHNNNNNNNEDRDSFGSALLPSADNNFHW